ncbi:MAG: hypothetical protein WCC04_15475 [Terriglobales bacterium]
MKALTAVVVFAAVISAHGQDLPKVYLTWKSTGTTWGAVRDQSQEMAKDFAKDCPDVQVTTNEHSWDYRVALNHIEHGFARDNQLAVNDMFGNVLSTTEKGSIKNGIKDVCALMLADWSNQTGTRQKLINSVRASAQKEGVVAYAEISGNKITVHSERASAMRFHMAMANEWLLSMLRRAGIATYIYTNDADQNFQYDVKVGKDVSPHAPQAEPKN